MSTKTGIITIEKNLLKIDSQLVGDVIGKNSPVAETSYIAAPNSINIEEEHFGDITTYNVTWTPLTTYLGEIRNDMSTYFNDISSKPKSSQPITSNFTIISNISKSGNVINIEKTPISVSAINTLISSVSSLQSDYRTLSETVNDLSRSLLELKSRVDGYHPSEKPVPSLGIYLSGSSSINVDTNEWFKPVFTVTTDRPSNATINLTVNSTSGVTAYFDTVSGSSLSGKPTNTIVNNNANVTLSCMADRSGSGKITIVASQSETGETSAVSRSQVIDLNITDRSYVLYVNIDSKKENMVIGETFVNQAILEGEEGINYYSNVNWTSSNTSVATISDVSTTTSTCGLVTRKTSTATITAKTSGSSIITATSEDDPTKSDQYVLHVSKKTTPTLTISNVPSSIVVNKQTWGTTSFNVSTNKADAGNINISTSVSGTSLSAYISKVNTSTIPGNKTSTSVANNSTVYISYFSNYADYGAIAIDASQSATTSTNAASTSKIIRYTVIEQYNPSIKIVSYQPTMTAGTSASLSARSYDIDDSYYPTILNTVNWTSSNSSVATISGISSSSNSSYIFSKAVITAKSAGKSTITVEMEDPAYGSSTSGYYLTDSFVVSVSGSVTPTGKYSYYFGPIAGNSENLKYSYFINVDNRLDRIDIPSTSSAYYFIYPKEWGFAQLDQFGNGDALTGSNVSIYLREDLKNTYFCTAIGSEDMTGFSGRNVKLHYS